MILSTVVAFVGVLLLVPLAVWWNQPASARVRRLRLVASWLAWVAIGLSVLSLSIHPALDHGATGKYPGWDWSLGLVYFGWEHSYYLFAAIVGLFAGWMVAKHEVWTVPPEARPELPAKRSATQKLVTVGQLVLAILLLAFTVAGWQIPTVQDSVHRSGPGPMPPKSMRITEAEPQGLEAACSLGEEIVLYRSSWAAWSDGDGARAVCRYSIHAAETPDVEECLLEFPVERARGLEASSLAARLARTYFRKRYGVNGLRLHSTGDPKRLFLLLSQEVCQWSGVVNGLRVVP